MDTRLVNVDALKQEIADELTISAVAERLCGVPLQRSGSQWVGLCPIHSESTPSFYINDARGLAHCFGCKFGGDSIELIRQVRNLDFVEALYALAAEADVDIEKYERPLSQAEKDLAVLRSQAEAWIKQVGVPDHGRVKIQTAIEFGVGLAPFSHPQFLPNQFTSGYIFPYRLPNGMLAGWKARPIDSKEMRGVPNSFPLYAETLFGIQIARDHLEDNSIIVVEGEYDCMTAHDVGIRNVVAMGGSAFVPAHMELLEKMHVRQVTLVFDGDEGGRRAAMVAADKYWAHDVMVRVAICPDGEDPDSLIKIRGPIEFDLIVRGARSALEHLLWTEWQSRSRESLSDKMEFVAWIRESYGAKLRATDEELVLNEVAKWLGVPHVEVRDFARKNETSLQVTDSERILLGHAIRDMRYFVELRKKFSIEDFYLIKHQRIWDILSRVMVDGLQFDVPTIARYAEAEGIATEYVQELAQVSTPNIGYHEDQVADMSLRRSTRDEILNFRDIITDISHPSDLAIGELTHKITERVLRKNGSDERQINEQVDQAMDVLHDRMKNPTAIHGLDLGRQFPKTSMVLQGLQPRRFVLLAASSGVGKSTMMIQWATALSVHQAIPTDIISLEMDEVEIVNKIASHMTQIDSMKISGGRLVPDEQKRVEFAMSRIRKSPLHIWAPDGVNAIEFLLYARESKLRRRTEAFFLDYIQLTDPDPGMERDNGYTQYGHFGRMAKMKVARAMDVSVICCAQLRREAADKERPNKEDMGDSYALVRHADVIVILSPQSANNVHLLVDKNRQGKGGDVLVPLKHNKPENTFYEAEGNFRDPEYAVKS